eukprot:5898540-Amphidinium_carterae.1
MAIFYWLYILKYTSEFSCAGQHLTHGLRNRQAEVSDARLCEALSRSGQHGFDLAAMAGAAADPTL